jgi:hypothetical protein
MRHIEFDFQPKTPNFNFPSYLLQKNMELQCNFQMLLLFIKGCDCGRIKSKSCSSSNTNIPVSVETIEIILIIQIVLLQIQITLVHTTLVVLDLQSILMDKQ